MILDVQNLILSTGQVGNSLGCDSTKILEGFEPRLGSFIGSAALEAEDNLDTDDSRPPP